MAKVNAYACDNSSCTEVGPRVGKFRAPSGWIEARFAVVETEETKRGKDRVFCSPRCLQEHIFDLYPSLSEGESEDPNHWADHDGEADSAKVGTSTAA